jgi:glycosyltransferase involved in cell wall biosynthesis
MQFHVISFEGPDTYAQAGGIASRVSGLTEALAEAGHDTHLWFVGDPGLPGHERRGRLRFHRWCQWISAHHPGGVYDGEEGKQRDFASSLPPYLVQNVLAPFLRQSRSPAVILAEEWHTVDAVLYLDWLLRRAGLRRRVAMFWNANNTFGFDRIDWKRLAKATVITTVSRYMRYKMWDRGVDPLVLPNGISAEALQKPERTALAGFRRSLQGRTVLGKVARWDPDKRWLLAVETLATLKRHRMRPLLIARGGAESHRREVLREAVASGISIMERSEPLKEVSDLIRCMQESKEVDMVILESRLDAPIRRILFKGADAILANSGHEPFGLVGLETMAVGGLACTGCTGEDYAVPGWNALVLQTLDPKEFMDLFQGLRMNPHRVSAVRRHAAWTARQHTWKAILERVLLPRIALSVIPPPGTVA